MKVKFYAQRSWLGYSLLPSPFMYYAKGTKEIDIYIAFWCWEIGVAVGLDSKFQ